jgi:sugar lactone lactonase YvrE
MNKQLIFATLAVIISTLSVPAAHAGDKPFPKRVPVLDGSTHEGFAIGTGTTAYSGSPDGSIYKVDLRSGQGEILVPAEAPFDVWSDCFKLGMRVDPRSNYLFVAGCFWGNAYVFDADTGEEIMNYQLAPVFSTVINDLAITRDAVYFTDFGQPFLYRLPLSRNGGLPAGADAATALPLTGDFADDHEEDSFSLGNGIVATPDGQTLIVGNSANAQIYRVDPATGHSDRIIVDPPLSGFLDGFVLHDGVLFILTPFGGDESSGEDWVQVVALDDEMLTGTRGIITDPDMNGVASGALFGDSLYVNNARYIDLPGEPPNQIPGDLPFWITRLSIYDVE